MGKKNNTKTGHGSKSRLAPSEHPNPHSNRPKWVAHLPQNGIPLVLTHSQLFGALCFGVPWKPMGALLAKAPLIFSCFQLSDSSKRALETNQTNLIPIGTLGVSFGGDPPKMMGLPGALVQPTRNFGIIMKGNLQTARFPLAILTQGVPNPGVRSIGKLAKGATSTVFPASWHVLRMGKRLQTSGMKSRCEKYAMKFTNYVCNTYIYIYTCIYIYILIFVLSFLGV